MTTSTPLHYVVGSFAASVRRCPGDGGNLVICKIDAGLAPSLQARFVLLQAVRHRALQLRYAKKLARRAGTSRRGRDSGYLQLSGWPCRGFCKASHNCQRRGLVQPVMACDDGATEDCSFVTDNRRVMKPCYETVDYVMTCAGVQTGFSAICSRFRLGERAWGRA
jgi:hypothetical protein